MILNIIFVNRMMPFEMVYVVGSVVNYGISNYGISNTIVLEIP